MTKGNVQSNGNSNTTDTATIDEAIKRIRQPMHTFKVVQTTLPAGTVITLGILDGIVTAAIAHDLDHNPDVMPNVLGSYDGYGKFFKGNKLSFSLISISKAQFKQHLIAQSSPLAVLRMVESVTAIYEDLANSDK